MVEIKEKRNILALKRQELNELLQSWGEASFRVAQIQRWIWHDRVFHFSDMTNLSKNMREKLAESFCVALPKLLKKEESNDGTVKYLFQLEDLKTIETVCIPRKDQGRVTVCISTQVGCRMGCTFCLTAQQKVERNLSSGEIAAQLLVLPCLDEVTNIVVMGMGEPFDNYQNLMDALEIITDPLGLGIGARKVTVSTSGLVPKIYDFVKSSKCRLAISLNAPNDQIRNQIMPINRAYPLEKLIGAVREVSSKNFIKPNMRDFHVTFEYILISEVNDQPEHARELVQLLKGLHCKINLLLYNENPNIPFKRPSDNAVSKFQAILMQAGILNFVRRSRGRDISAACGQLASESKRLSQLEGNTTVTSSVQAI